MSPSNSQHWEALSFTAVVPVHNGSRFLQQALDSIAAQTFPRWECVIVVDASRDSSYEIAASWARGQGSRVRILRNEGSSPCGVATSRNRGIDASTAPWVAFLDQDDIWEPMKLEQQAEFISGRPVLAGVGCFPKLFFDGVDRLPFIEKWVAMIHSIDEKRASKLCLRDFVAGCPFCLSGVVARRSSLRKLGGFDASLVRTSDWMMWAQMATREPLGLVRHELVTYRLHGDNEVLKLTNGPLERATTFLEIRSRLADWLSRDRGLSRECAAAVLDDLICEASVEAPKSIC
jgi:glycosyltransferase involved in cell wall biosynthesis